MPAATHICTTSRRDTDAQRTQKSNCRSWQRPWAAGGL